MSGDPIRHESVYPARVHPIRCAASLPNPTVPSSGSCKAHHCIHPAAELTYVVGLAVHLCRCGTEWTEKTHPEPAGENA